MDYSEEGKLEFRVRVCKWGTSPLIQSSIWDAQHFCVSDSPDRYMYDDYDDCPSINDESAGAGVIKHQLKVEHYSVLEFAFIKFKCYGFPHSVMQQVTRHSDTSFLATSMRYTGAKFVKVAQGELPVEDAFYVRPPGTYTDRSGRSINWTTRQRKNKYNACMIACEQYRKDIDDGMPYEMARESLPFCYRQPFTMAGNVKDFFHFLDQRSKKDSEREIRTLALLCMEEFKLLAPQFYDWYMDTRWSRARLAP